MNRLVAAAALAAFVGALVVIAFSSASGGDNGTDTAPAVPTVTRPATRPTTTTSAPSLRPVKLAAVGAFDPEGDQHENDDLAPLAVDGDSSTFWKTEHYTNGFFKKGVGLVLDAGKPRRLSKVIVSTDGSGARAQIELGTNPNGPFRAVSDEQGLSGRTTFTLKQGSAGRYVVVWITALPPAIGEGHVTEVRAVGG